MLVGETATEVVPLLVGATGVDVAPVVVVPVVVVVDPVCPVDAEDVGVDVTGLTPPLVGDVAVVVLPGTVPVMFGVTVPPGATLDPRGPLVLVELPEASVAGDRDSPFPQPTSRATEAASTSPAREKRSQGRKLEVRRVRAIDLAG